MFDDLNSAMSELDPAFRQSRYPTVSSIVNAGVNLVLASAISISVIALVYGFIQFGLTWGDPKNMKKARDAVIWSLIAILISVMAYGIKAAILNAANAPDLVDPNI